MPHRSHLFSLTLGYGLKQSLLEGYGKQQLVNDLFAGISVGVIAVPLAMALAIASGVPPQYGLYTAIIAGIVIALSGGSRFSVSGPTAAFVVILAPISSTMGLEGLLTATVLAGLMLVAMSLARLGRFIEYIPSSVTLGFTAGIAIVIFTIQIPDGLGIELDKEAVHYWEKVSSIARQLPDTSIPDLLIACLTLAIMFSWPKLGSRVPPHLPALLGAVGGAWLLAGQDIGVATINSHFQYSTPEGDILNGIPPYLPTLDWPWAHTTGEASKLDLSWDTLRILLPASFAIAMLGAIESLLCAVILDEMSGKRHSANSELLGQGLGNVITPFFGGIPATAAIARSAANFKAGAVSPVSTVIHSVVVLVSLLFLPRFLGMIPMAAMAALLMIVAWNMSEIPKAIKLVKTAPYNDVVVFVTCMSLTVLFDMVIAISAGIVLASLLFMKNVAEMTRIHDISRLKKLIPIELAESVAVYKINGPLFFAAADRVFSELSVLGENKTTVVLYLDGVSILDAGGLAALMKYAAECESRGTRLLLADFQLQPLKTLARSGFSETEKVRTFSTLDEAVEFLGSGMEGFND